MRKSNSDASKVRQVLDSYEYTAVRYYSESRQTFRRVKAYLCEVNSSHLRQVEDHLRQVFGDRLISCYNQQSQIHSSPFVSFIVKLAPINHCLH